MKKLFSAMTLLLAAAGFSAQAYNCPANVYFYVSEATSSTAFEKNQTVFTYTVDASAADVFGVIVSSNATSWTAAHSTNTYIPNGKYGDIVVDGATDWGAMSEWQGTANNQWSNGCLKFVKGKKYEITLVHANGTFTGTVSVEGEEIETPAVSGFDTEKDYYINASACTWFFDAGAVIKVSDGKAAATCEDMGAGLLKFRPTSAGTAGMLTIQRIAPTDGTVWNSYSLQAPTNAEHNIFTINSSFNGGTWGTYATPEAWLISEGINDWSADAKSDYVFAYDEATGIYTVEVPAAKLTAEGEGNGFKIGYGALNDWDNYYGAAVANKVLANGVTTAAQKNGKNFLIPDDLTANVTLAFNLKEGKITASWNTSEDPDDPIITPIESEDLLLVSLPKMDVNGSTTVEVTLQAAPDKEYCSANWDIVVPEGFTVSDITLNRERCADHVLETNEVNGVIKCTVYSAKNTTFVRAARPLFSFKLTADNASVGEVTGSLSNIIFNTVPSEGNLNIASKFEDTPLNITVVKAVSKITATPANVALKSGESQEITLSIEPADATDQEVTWEIIAGDNVIDLADGTVTAKASGIATIKVTANDGFGASVTIDVTVDGKNVEAITLSATEHTMYIGETTTLTATVTPDDATNKAIMWVSSDDNVATVDDNGLVTGTGAGEATIYAIAKDGSDVQATCEVTIKAKVSGDADGDDHLTIADIVIIAKKSVGIDTEGMHLENMDMDRDGNITSTDITLAVYYLNMQETVDTPENVEMSANRIAMNDPMAISAESFFLPITLPEARNVAAVQFDVELPENFELTSDSYVAPESANGHEISVTAMAPGTYRVIIYSAHNFNGDNLGYLNIRNSKKHNGTVTVKLSNIRYSDGNKLMAADDTTHTFTVFASSIDDILADDANALYDVYSVAGICLGTQMDKAAVKALPAGIYVINGQKVAL